LVSLDNDIESADSLGVTLLLKACNMGNIDIAIWLNEKGANIQSVDIFGRNGFHYACMNKHEMLVEPSFSQANKR